MDMTVKDSNGTTLNDGDSVQIIKDLKVKGTSITSEKRDGDKEYPPDFR